jgi:hypothetical protein
MSGFFHDRQLVQWLCAVRDGGAEFFGLPGDWPGGCRVARVDVLEGDPERSEMQSSLAETREINS